MRLETPRAVTKRVKNVSENELGDKMGRIHLGRQDLSSMKVSGWSPPLTCYNGYFSRVRTKM